MNNISNVLADLLVEHKSFLLLVSDVAGHSIDGNAWLRVRSYLSPNTRYSIIEPIMMTPEIFENTKIFVSKGIEFKARGQIKFYLAYKFPDYEGAACNEFLLRAAPFHMTYSIGLPTIQHSISKGIDDPNKVFGMISISRSGPTEIQNAADTYNRVAELLEQQRH
jgi:hypothetical protein